VEGPILAWIEPFASPEETRAHMVQRRFFAGGLARAEKLGFRIERFQSRATGMTPARLTGMLLARGIEGVILLPQPLHLAPEYPCEVARFACVSLGRAHDARRLHTTASNVADAMRTACRELHARGYRRIGCMLPHFVERLTGFQFAAGYLATLGAELRIDALPILYGYGLEGPAGADFVCRGPVSPELARDSTAPEAFRRWLEEARPDAVISTHAEAMDELRRAGLGVPQDVAFACLGLDPADGELAGVDQRLEQVAAAAVDMVIAQLTRNERGLPDTPKTLMISGVWRDGPSVGLQVR
jgi:DNA-binding LacI/PurR family transcriptional regulator